MVLLTKQESTVLCGLDDGRLYPTPLGIEGVKRAVGGCTGRDIPLLSLQATLNSLIKKGFVKYENGCYQSFKFNCNDCKSMKRDVSKHGNKLTERELHFLKEQGYPFDEEGLYRVCPDCGWILTCHYVGF